MSSPSTREGPRSSGIMARGTPGRPSRMAGFPPGASGAGDGGGGGGAEADDEDDDDDGGDLRGEPRPDHPRLPEALRVRRLAGAAPVDPRHGAHRSRASKRSGLASASAMREQSPDGTDTPRATSSQS